jgi:acetolactate synthase-1/2/3 large subunit
MRKVRKGGGSSNVPDGGEAMLQALRALDIDYVMTSPGSEWGSLWEAFARQDANGAAGPVFLSCGHETLAVDLAIGYTRHTGRMQAVVLHAGVGLLQGSVGIDAANRLGVPMVVFSGESMTYGELPDFDPGYQWTSNLSVPGGPHRLLAPIVKWSGQATSTATMYEQIVRAGEMAQRTPPGPIYLDVPIETMLADWTPPSRERKVPHRVKPHAPMAEIEKLAERLMAAKLPVITTESAGRDTESYHALGELAELLAIPVVETGSAEYSNFPKTNPLHQGVGFEAFVDTADLVLMVRSRAPWYPPSSRPKNATIVAIDEMPFHASMVYQNLHADMFVEGDVAYTLKTLAALVRAGKIDAKAVAERRARCVAGHKKMREAYRTASVPKNGGISPPMLCQALGDTLPAGTIYVDETITHRPDTLRHLDCRGPQTYYRASGGLGQGIGLALGHKLAAPDKLVVSVIGDGSFLYNPLTQSLALSKKANLPVLVVIFNNGGYRAMMEEHHSYYPEGVAAANKQSHGFPTTGFEYSELVKPFGGAGERVDSPADLKPALERCAAAVSDGRTAILDVRLER